MKMNKTVTRVNLRLASKLDLHALDEVEKTCFDYDRLSTRSLSHWIKSENGIFVVAEQAEKLLGYGLVWCHKGTRLSRLYSVAVLPSQRGKGLARQLIQRLEILAAERGHIFMRLEVSKKNTAAIGLYESYGYRVFGEYTDYYDDHADALRMQKTIRNISQAKIERKTEWYQQTTNFTCGPASLMMGMLSLDDSFKFSQSLELDIWREATTIFMTSGHGGCHPLGLALSADKRGFEVKVFLNTQDVLSSDGVRRQNKKDGLKLVHNNFLAAAQGCENIDIIYEDISVDEISQSLTAGYAILVLISTYMLDDKKAPHWVLVTAVDEYCLYVHDPDIGEGNHQAIDCQHMPIARLDFEKMSAFGISRLRTAILIRKD